MFRAKGVMRPKGLVIKAPPPQNRRKRGGKAETVTVRPSWNNPNASEASTPETPTPETPLQSPDPSPSPTPATPTTDPTTPELVTEDSENTEEPSSPQITLQEAIEQVSSVPATAIECATPTEQIYCPECYLPLHPDPKPEKLYIFLHALKYTTSLGAFSTEMPDWAAEGWEWDRDD